MPLQAIAGAGNMRGKLIVFEGIEGSGKTTQLNRLSHWLDHDAGFQQRCQYHQLVGITVTRQPGGTSIGRAIRQLLLHSSPEAGLCNRTELLLYAADRAQHVHELIRPKLESGNIVLCDRYTDSTVAYQGYGRQLDLDLIHQLNAIATDGIWPDLTILLKLDAAAGLSRTFKRGPTDRIEQSGLAFHQRVQQGFEALAEQHSQRFATIDASQSEAAITQQIGDLVTQRLEQWYPLP
ncbi:MAG: dTMP kinase [Cyanobacteria bacterium P01_D01_bin.14]